MSKISETQDVDGKLEGFKAWLETCRSRREMLLGRAKWDNWVIDRTAKGDARYKIGGEIAKKFGELWDARKKQLLSVESLFKAESTLRSAAMAYAMGATPDSENALRLAANRFSAVFNFFDGQTADENLPAPSETP